MSDERLAQQVTQLAEQQARLSDDIARVKEQLDYLSVVLVGLSEQRDEPDAPDEEVPEDIEQRLEVINDQINQLTALIGQVLESVTRQSKQVTDLYGHHSESCSQITRVYERLNEVLQLFDVVLRNTGAQDAEAEEDEAETGQAADAEEAAEP